MAINASRLRADIYRVLDEVLATGRPVEIERKGRRLRIVPDRQPSKLARLVSRPAYLRGDPEAVVHVDWSRQWKPGRL
jgi:hypothetical protein